MDLTNPAGMQILMELISISDVCAENFTARAITNFHLEYEDGRSLNPGIVMVSSTGY